MNPKLTIPLVIATIAIVTGGVLLTKQLGIETSLQTKIVATDCDGTEGTLSLSGDTTFTNGKSAHLVVEGGKGPYKIIDEVGDYTVEQVDGNEGADIVIPSSLEMTDYCGQSVRVKDACENTVEKTVLYDGGWALASEEEKEAACDAEHRGKVSYPRLCWSVGSTCADQVYIEGELKITEGGLLGGRNWGICSSTTLNNKATDGNSCLEWECSDKPGFDSYYKAGAGNSCCQEFTDSASKRMFGIELF